MLKIGSGKIKFFALLFLIAIIIFLAKIFDLQRFISPPAIREAIVGYGTAAPVAYILFYIIATLLFLPGTPLTIASGLIFGKFFGTLYTIIGATIGATFAFLMARYLGASFVEKILKNKYKKIYEYDKKIEKNGLLVVIFLRLVPLFPFNGLNFALGLTKLKKKDFIIGTSIGIIPGSFVLAFFGDSLAELNIVKITLAILLFVLLALAPVLHKKLKKQ